VLTDEAKGYAARGSPEVQLLAAIPPEGASKAALKVTSPSVGFRCSIGVNGSGLGSGVRYLGVQLESRFWV
jgi:hypothetical protein